MASSREAFLKFDKWKNSRTVLNLTVVNIVDDECFEDRFQGAIFFADEDDEILGFVDDESRNSVTLDLSGGSFAMDARSVEVKCPDRGTVTFAEVLLV
jgi:hypothetical protein